MPKRILTVFAHPDDESFGPAGLLARYATGGAWLGGLWLTRGEVGESVVDHAPSPDELAAIRERDLRDAAAVIGYAEVDLRSFPDGGLADLPPGDLERTIVEAIEQSRPNVVLTFGPGGISGHGDHIALSAAVTSVFHSLRQTQTGLSELYYNAVAADIARERNLEGLPDGNPNTFIDVAEYVLAHREALACHARHMADAREMLARLDQQPRAIATLYRAWPPVPDGQRISGFLEVPSPVGSD
ncbi:MAG: PIG-L deacetylase family protein [Thermomicrobiales bacterium]